MSSALYNRDILRLAASIPHQGRLTAPEGSADKRSPTCGSRVIADVRLDDKGCLAELGLEVHACALGQASAALLGAHAVGRSAEELAMAGAALRQWLIRNDPAEEALFWPGYSVMAAARAYPARHPSILLCFDAVNEAIALAIQHRALVSNSITDGKAIKA